MTLNVVKLKTRDVQNTEEVVEILENLMALAQDGKIQSMCHVVKFSDGDCGSAYSRGFTEDVFAAIASIECLKARFINLAINNDNE